MELALGFSPCPNDTFIFDALIHHKIDTEGLDFEVSFDDVETLNQKAFRQELDITKLSFHAFAYAINDYVLLDSGSALGFGVGPLLVSKSEPSALGFQLSAPGSQPSVSSFWHSDFRLQSSTVGSQSSDFSPPTSILQHQSSSLKIGIPGKYTTANFLLNWLLPEAQNKSELVFSEIEDALLNGSIDLGLIIHENRFTYQDKGLHLVYDLGELWEKSTGCAIPLGGIVIKRDLPNELKLKVNRVLKKSVEYAFANPKSSLDFIKQHAQAMDEAVMYKHIELYVNKYSIDLGTEGRRAIQLLFDTALEKGIIPELKQSIFLT